MKLQLISELEYERIASQPNDPPALTTAFPQESFSNEFWSFVERVRTVAKAFDAEDGEGLGGDYWVNNGFEYSRRVSLELHTSKLLTNAFLVALMGVIEKYGPTYRIDVTHDMLEEDFVFLLVYKDKVLAVSDVMTPLLQKLLVPQ